MKLVEFIGVEIDCDLFKKIESSCCDEKLINLYTTTKNDEESQSIDKLEEGID